MTILVDRVLTVRQPWASLIAMGRKTLEIRSWGTGYRGPLLIHAAQKNPLCRKCGGRGWHMITGRPCACWPAFAVDAQDLARMLDDGQPPTGVLLCVVDVVGCRAVDLNNPNEWDAIGARFEPNPAHYAWQLANPRPVPQTKYTGKLSIWRLPHPIAVGA